ncbi:MAG TPA: tRNA (guanine(46)-N(7))-methyltransferase TrmB [Rhizomicrobium sp.]
MPAPSDRIDEKRKTRRRGSLYGRRKGPKLSAHRAALLEGVLPRLKLELSAGIDPKNLFEAPVDELWLEIGFGAGEHLLWQAEHHPGIGIIGAEPYQTGVAKLLSKLPQKETEDYISRIRIYEGDARDILEVLPDACLGRIFLLFPDPWPKTRHHKRRFIQMDLLDELARVMKSGAEFRFASDDPGYVEWTLERMLLHSGFEWMAVQRDDWFIRPPDWPATRYEQKALHGVPVFLRFRRL